MKEYQFSRLLEFGNLFNSLHFYEGFDHEKNLIYPGASENFTTLDKILVPAFL